MIKIKKSFLIFIIIFVIAAFFRFFRIEQSPARLNHDEMSFAYNAYSILKTGKDEWNKPFPLIFTAFGDYKLPLNIYLSVPFVALLGLNALSTRIVSILSGLAMVVIMYFFTYALTKRKDISLLSALILAVNPWPIQVSRVAINTHLGLVFFSLGLTLFIKARQTKSQLLAAIAGVSWALTAYDYVAYRVIIFLVGLVLFAYAIFKRNYETRLVLTAFVAMVIVLLPLAGTVFGTAGTARFKTTSIFYEAGIPMAIDEKRAFCYLNDKETLPALCRIPFNKPVSFTASIAKNWASFIMPTFLFIKGDENIALNMPDYGMFLFVLLPFYLIGLYVWFKKGTFEANLIKLSFLVAPIPSSLTGVPQTMRGTALIPFIVLFIATGIMTTYEYLKNAQLKQLFSIGLSLLVAFSLFKYSLDYFYIFPAQHDDAAYMIDKRIADYVKANEHKFDEVIIDNKFPDAYILLAFYNRIDPQWLADNLVRYEADKFGFMHAKQLGKYYFIRPDLKRLVCDPLGKRTLVFTDPSEKTPATEVFYNFSRVHPQIHVYDTWQIRDYLSQQKQLDSYCLK